MDKVKRWLPLVQFLLIIIVIFTLVQWISPRTIKPSQIEIPPGWQIIRPPHDVSALVIQGDIVWVGGKDGVVGLDRFSGKFVATLPCDPPPAFVQALLVDRIGILWIGHQAGLTRYDGENCRIFTKEDGLSDNSVNALLLDREGKLWVGTSDGVAVYNGRDWRVFTSADGMASDIVNVMLEDRYGGMWLGSYVGPRGGLSYFKEGKWQLFSTDNGLLHNNINALFEDLDGNIWVGTGFLDRGGAVKFALTDSGWMVRQVLTTRDGLAGNKVRSIFQDRDGVLWFGSEYDGLTRLEGNHWKILTEKDGLSHNEVKSMLQDADGNLWIGTWDGITRLNATALDALR